MAEGDVQKRAGSRDVDQIPVVGDRIERGVAGVVKKQERRIVVLKPVPFPDAGESHLEIRVPLDGGFKGLLHLLPHNGLVQFKPDLDVHATRTGVSRGDYVAGA